MLYSTLNRLEKISHWLNVVEEERKISRRDLLRGTAIMAVASVLQALLPEGSRAIDIEEKLQNLQQHINEISHFDKILCLPPDPDLLLPEHNANLPLFQKLRSSGEKKLFWRPPEIKESLEVFPLMVRDQFTDGLCIPPGDSLFCFSFPEGNLTTERIVSPDSNGWKVPFPKPEKNNICRWIDVMATPSSLDGKQAVYGSLFLTLEGVYPVYTIADFSKKSCKWIEGTQVCWQSPALVEGGDLMVVVGNQYNACRPPNSPRGAGVEWINLEDGTKDFFPLGNEECLPDGVPFQVGRLHPESDNLQVGLPLAESYLIIDRKGNRFEARHIKPQPVTILADVDNDGLHEIVASVDGGKIAIAKAHDPSWTRTFSFREDDPTLSWRVTSLSAFRYGERTLVFASAATGFFKQSRLMVIESNGKTFFNRILKTEGKDMPVGYGLAGAVTGSGDIVLASPGYEPGTGQRRLSVMLYNSGSAEIKALKVYRLGTWEDGIVSLGRPTVARVSEDKIGVFSEVNLRGSSRKTWIIGLGVDGGIPKQKNVATWTHAVGGDSDHNNALPLVFDWGTGLK